MIWNHDRFVCVAFMKTLKSSYDFSAITSPQQSGNLINYRTFIKFLDVTYWSSVGGNVTNRYIGHIEVTFQLDNYIKRLIVF